MDILLDPNAIRVLGVLLEKGMATPDHYPMTLNALIAGCNQKSSREPVTALSEADVLDALDPLREARMAGPIRTAGSRTTKYEERLAENFHMNRRELAVLAVLMLRGPQTVGELRNRTGRMYEFNGLSEVERTLKELEAREDGPWVIELPRRPGRKEPRFAHLLGGPVAEAQTPEAESETGPTREPVSERMARLEAEVADLREEVMALREAVAEFRELLE
ncbi:MAG: YceH family protein [Desulfococcaceae bacterium]